MKTLSCISTAVLACLVVAAPASAASPITPISLAITPQTEEAGGPVVSYTVSGKAPEEHHEVYVRVLEEATPSEQCSDYYSLSAKDIGQFRTIYSLSLKGNKKFSHTEGVPIVDDATKGTYLVCAYLTKQSQTVRVASAESTLTVTESATERKAREATEEEEAREAREAKEREARELHEAEVRKAQEREAEARKRYEEEHQAAPTPLAPPVVTPAPAPAPTVTAPPAATVLTGSLANTTSVLTPTQKLHKALAKCKRQHPKSKRVKCERAAKRAAKHR